MKRLENFLRQSVSVFVAFIFALLVMSALPAQAQVASAAPHTIEQSVIASGGTSSGGAGNIYLLEGAIGEPVAGTTSTNLPLTIKGGFFTANALAPTAAGVTVGGRVVTSAGKGIRNVRITMTGSSGEIRTTVSSTFGRFSFTGVPAGETYVFNVTGKRFTFKQPVQIRSIMEDTSNIIFIGETIGLPVQ